MSQTTSHDSNKQNVRHRAHSKAQYRTNIVISDDFMKQRQQKLSTKFQSGKDGVRPEGEYGGHFTGHAEAALVTFVCTVSDT